MHLRWMTTLTLAAGLAMGAAAYGNGSRVVLAGQVTCSACWFEADRTKVPYGGAEDLACAERCAKEGVPASLAVRDEAGGFELWRLEAGAVELGERGFLPWTGKHVEAHGIAVEEGERRKLVVEALTERVEPAKPAAGVEPAELRLADLGGAHQSLEALRGRVVVLNFWATWCKPCRDEMPLLARLQTRFAPLGVQFIGASADAAAEVEAVTRFASDAGMNFPVWLGATTDDMQRLGLVPALPGTLVLDRHGRPVERFAGVVTEPALTSAITRALGDVPRSAVSEAVEPTANAEDTVEVATTASKPRDRGTSPGVPA